VLAAVREHFRPEFVNRIDEIVVFEALGPGEIRRIVEIQLQALEARLADRDLTLEVTPAALDLLAAEGFDPAFGARPLRRVIQRELQDPLALKLLSGEIAEGDTVKVDVRDGQVLLASAV
jgi:ATP-dependent Clp protease ATP-binding subunit ClpB